MSNQRFPWGALLTGVVVGAAFPEVGGVLILLLLLGIVLFGPFIVGSFFAALVLSIFGGGAATSDADMTAMTVSGVLFTVGFWVWAIVDHLARSEAKKDAASASVEADQRIITRR
jgi:hypothetical protein